MAPWQILAAIILVMAITAGGTWRVQDWRYGEKLAEQAGLHQADLTTIGNAAAAQARAEQDKRLGLEGRLQSIDEAHFKEFSDEQKKYFKAA